VCLPSPGGGGTDRDFLWARQPSRSFLVHLAKGEVVVRSMCRHASPSHLTRKERPLPPLPVPGKGTSRRATPPAPSAAERPPPPPAPLLKDRETMNTVSRGPPPLPPTPLDRTTGVLQSKGRGPPVPPLPSKKTLPVALAPAVPPLPSKPAALGASPGPSAPSLCGLPDTIKKPPPRRGRRRNLCHPKPDLAEVNKRWRAFYDVQEVRQCPRNDAPRLPCHAREHKRNHDLVDSREGATSVTRCCLETEQHDFAKVASAGSSPTCPRWLPVLERVTKGVSFAPGS